jgi:acyl-CoA synthetase (NDP forming)
MTIHALTRILNPKSIAVIGASSRENNLGHWLLRSIINGGYTGSVYPVNPKGGEILGLQVITDIESLPDSIDLAIASIPAPAVPQTIASLGTKGPAGVVVVAGGFAEVGDEGKALQQELTSAAIKAGVRLLGPNTIGFINTRSNLNASFSPEMGGSVPGSIGVISQSGSVCETLYFRCLELGVGFSTLIAAGNEADLDMCDYLEYLLDDPNTSVIALYVEQIRRPKRFVELIKDRPNQKPVVMFRTGRTARGKMAAASHTGAMAGSDAIMSGLCRQVDVVDARSYDDLIDSAVAFSGNRFPKGRRMAVVTGTGRAGRGGLRCGHRGRFGNGVSEQRNIRPAR